MCVIIHKPSNISLPMDKVKNAVLRNKDGYGILFHDGEKVNEIRELESSPDIIARRVEELNDVEALIHLRFATAGDISLDNTHPFPVLDEFEDGISIWCMHNGTVHDYKEVDKDSSGINDTRQFITKVLTPMFGRTLCEPDIAKLSDIINDEFNQIVLTKMLGNTANVFSFMDQYGNIEFINHHKGTEFDEGWWASNNSYFKEPVVVTPTTKTYPVKTVYAKPIKGTAPASCLQHMFTQQFTIPQIRDDCYDKLGFKDHKDIYKLDIEALEEIIEHQPSLAIDLITDLASRLYEYENPVKSNVKYTSRFQDNHVNI